MNWDQIITLLVLLATIVVLVREWLPVGLVGVLSPLVLVVLGVMDGQLAWSGFAHPAVIAVGAMFVVAAGVSRTGALSFVGQVLVRLGRKGHRRIVLAMMVVVAVLSAFVNNTTVVLVFIPVVLSLCERLEQSPSRYLIPLSFASIFGGMLTLVGTSTNVVVAEAGHATLAELGRGADFELGMWDFAPMGLVFLAFGLAYMTTLGRSLLPRRQGLVVPLERGLPTEYVTEGEVLPGSRLIGRTIADLRTRHAGLRVLQLIRNDVILQPEPSMEITVGDVLLVKGRAGEIMDLQVGSGTQLLPDLQQSGVRARTVDATLAEVIVPPGSRWIGRAVQEIGFRDRYGVSVIAVQRHGQHIRQKLGELHVQPADIILLQGSVYSLRKLRVSDNLILVEGVAREVKLRQRAPVALAGLALFVGLASSGWLGIAVAAMVAASFMVLSRCITLQEAFDAVDWNIVFILAGSLALGRAVSHVHLDSMAASGLIQLTGDLQPLWIVAIVYAATSLLTDLISNGAAAALMIPLAVQAAIRLEASPVPFLMAVAFGASCAFMTPVGYQTNLLVYAPGGYRFRDFVVVGLPLRILFLILATIFIPLFYPL